MNKDDTKSGSEKEAQMIMDITEKLGMQLARRKKEVVASVTKQLLNGNILDN